MKPPKHLTKRTLVISDRCFFVRARRYLCFPCQPPGYNRKATLSLVFICEKYAIFPPLLATAYAVTQNCGQGYTVIWLIALLDITLALSEVLA